MTRRQSGTFQHSTRSLNTPVPEIGHPTITSRIARSPLRRMLLRWPACALLGVLPGAVWPAWTLEPDYRFSPAAFGSTLASLAALSWLAYLDAAARDPRRGRASMAEASGSADVEPTRRPAVGHQLGMAAMGLLAIARRNALFALAVLPLALALWLARAGDLDFAAVGAVANGSRGSRVSQLDLDPQVLAAIAIGLALLALARGHAGPTLELLPLALITGLIAWAPLASWAAEPGWPETGSAAWLIFWPFSAPVFIGTGPGAWAGIGGLLWAAWLELLAGPRGPRQQAHEPGPSAGRRSKVVRRGRGSRRNR